MVSETEIAALCGGRKARKRLKMVTPPIVKERCSRCHVVLGDMDKAMAETNRLWRALNGHDIDDFDKRAEAIMHMHLDGLQIGPDNRNGIKAMLAEHFEQIAKDRR